MSNIAIKGATTGTGTFTIESPATNTDRTLTLPDEAGTVLTSGATSLASTVAQSSVAFHVTAVDIDQAYPDGQPNVVVQFNNTLLDTHNYWDETNHRFTPQVSGWYWFGGAVRFVVGGTAESYVGVQVEKNGTAFSSSSLFSQRQVQGGTTLLSNDMIPLSSGLIYLNGSTDYANVVFRASTACTLSDASNVFSHFSGFLVRQA